MSELEPHLTLILFQYFHTQLILDRANPKIWYSVKYSKAYNTKNLECDASWTVFSNALLTANNDMEWWS